MSHLTIPSVHRALLVASLAATVVFFGLPAVVAVIAGLGTASAGVALGFTGLIVFALAPWIFLAAYCAGLLAVFGARTVGVDLERAALPTHQALGVGMAAGLTLLGGLISNEVEPLWLVFTLPAGFVAGSVFFRRVRVAH